MICINALNRARLEIYFAYQQHQLLFELAAASREFDRNEVDLRIRHSCSVDKHNLLKK